MDDFATIQSSVQSNLVATTRGVSRLAEEDIQFHRSLEPSIGTQLDAQNARLLNLAQRLLGSATTSSEAVRPSLKDIDDVEGNWTKVVDVIDSLLERADTALDEFTGAVKRLNPKETAPKTGPHNLASAFRNQEIDKPQLKFEDKTDNYPKGPFRPLLTSKPHSVTPLQTESEVLEDTETPAFRHPYQHEIEQYTYPSRIYTSAEPIAYLSFEKTKATLVDTEEALETMLKELKAAKEIAVDLEHHDTRSYIGVVSLMQISTRNHDWIVDTLKPWRRRLSRLNEVFADPSIVKVFHGAYMDIIWLQRDLGLYIVGLFDTYSAARSLGYPQASYAFLLKTFTGVDAQKQFQMADWRIRPLPQELIDYARSDTHYLLYIFDHMRNELLQKSKVHTPDRDRNRIWDVQERSKETALQRYEHPVYDSENGQGALGWFKILSRTPANFTKEQFSVFRAVHQWRDNVAREQDDSVHFVIPNHVVFSVAKSTPTTKADVLRVAQPLTQAVKLRVEELVDVIAQAKENAEDGPSMIEVLQHFDNTAAKKAILATLPDEPRKLSGVSGFLSRASDSLGASIASSLPLRSMTSLFWGKSMKAPDKQQKRLSSTAVQISLPLPPLTEEIFAEPGEPVTQPVASVESSPVQQTPTRQEDEDVFILKELNKKRKLTAVTDQDEMQDQADTIALPDEEAERARLKAEKKRAKREAKRAVKASLVDSTSAGHAEELPFDYASAPSVLHQPAPDKKAKVKKTFDPYSKSMNAPKGLPRVQKESAGRSMTYTS